MKRRRRQLADLHVLRYVPGTSALHRCWAGTKLLAIALVSVGLLLWPTWSAAGLAAVLLLTSVLVGRLPSGITPRVPRWLIILLLVGALLALAAGGRPHVRVGGLALGLGGLSVWARFLLIGVEILSLAAVVSWTTALADLAPALARLCAPFRRLPVPVDEVIAAVALGVRCLPLLLEEARVLAAARRTRRPERPRSWKERADGLEEVLYTGLSSALRRARELAEAIEARGGTAAPVPDEHAVGGLDVTVLIVVAAAVAGMALLR